jgi:exonuclease VII small subunit
MGLLDLIEKAINEHASAEIMGQRLALFREHADTMQKRVTALEQENAALKHRISEYERDLASKTALEEFVEHRGALFKRKPSGGYQLAAYCPSCRVSMGGAHPRVPFHCGRCHNSTNFNVSELNSIIRALPSA